MKKIIFLSLLFGFLFKIEAQENKQSNIVVFLVDDMGWQDTSVAFSEEKTENNQKYNTPNMHRLSDQGITYTNAYASSVCSPSRVSLITGANPARHRVTNWTLEYNTPTDVENEKLTPPKWNVNGMSLKPNVENTFVATPLPLLLKENGYHTIHIGKAHFAAKGLKEEDPLNIGFEVNVAGHAAGGLPTYSGLKNFGNDPEKEVQSPFAIPHLQHYWGKDISVTEALTIEALNKLNDRPKDKPFFLYLSHYAVHTPIEADSRFVQKYLDKGLDVVEARYCSMVEAMDKSLGDVLDYLSENKLLDNTFILFLSDNGGLSFRSGKPLELNFPLKSGKGSAYEGGIRIPMIASWGNQLKKSKNHSPIIIEDVFPSILKIAGINNPKVLQTIDGKDFTPTFASKQINQKRPLYWHFPNNWYHIKGHGFGASSTIRKGDWKLIYFYETNQVELYHLKDDLQEKNDLSKVYPKRAKKLQKRLMNYLKEVKAQFPVAKG